MTLDRLIEAVESVIEADKKGRESDPEWDGLSARTIENLSAHIERLKSIEDDNGNHD